MLSKSGQNLDWIEKHGIQARDVHNSTRRMNIGQIVPRLQGMLCTEFLLLRTLIKLNVIVEFISTVAEKMVNTPSTKHY